MKKLTSVVALAALAMLATGCNRAKSSAEQAVRENLKDPDSARFGEFYYNAKLKRACLTVNAKNSMGGYIGNQQVLLTRTDNGWDWNSPIEESPEDCRKNWADNTSQAG